LAMERPILFVRRGGRTGQQEATCQDVKAHG